MKTIGFVNGCFDLFHDGHQLMLGECMAQCDHLIVAINSDESVERLKGPTRPVNDWWKRAEDITRYLDIVRAGTDKTFGIISFEGQEDPLLMNIRPQRLFKGYDHSSCKIMYRRIGWKQKDGPIFEGPEIIKLPHLPGVSTNAIIAEPENAKA